MTMFQCLHLENYLVSPEVPYPESELGIGRDGIESAAHTQTTVKIVWGKYSCFLFLSLFDCYFVFLLGFFETGILCIALAVLEITMYTRLALNSVNCLPLPPECWNYRHAPPLLCQPLFLN